MKGTQSIRKETEYKAAILYKTLDDHSVLKSSVINKDDRSNTVIVAESGQHTERLTSYLQGKGFFPGEGFGEFKKSQLRFANFPAHSKEQFEGLVDAIAAYQ